MLKTKLPGRARRALGSGLFAMASVVLGIAAWAAEPGAATSPGSAPNGAQSPEPGGKKLVLGDRGVLRFNRDVQLQTSANVVTNGPNGAQILEGNVRITAIPPAGKQHLVRVLKTPDGEKREESYEQPRTIVLNAEKVTVTPTSEGGVILEFEGGSIEHP